MNKELQAIQNELEELGKKLHKRAIYLTYKQHPYMMDEQYRTMSEREDYLLEKRDQLLIAKKIDDTQ